MAITTALSGGNLGQVVSSGLRGAAAGAILGGIGGYYGNSWNLARTAVSAIGGGVASDIEGGSFEKGALLAGSLAAAGEIYEDIVSEPADAAPGGPAVEKSSTEGGVGGANNWGLGSPIPVPQRTSWWPILEGSPISNFMNQIPGMDAVATLHDNIMAWIQTNSSNAGFDIINVPAMLPAAAITTGALAGQYPGIEIGIATSDH